MVEQSETGGIVHPACTHMLPAVAIPCPVADGLFFSAAKEKRKKTPQGTDGSLPSFILSQQILKPLHAEQALPLTRSAAYPGGNAEKLTANVFFHHRYKPFLNHSPSEWFSLYKKRCCGAAPLFAARRGRRALQIINFNANYRRYDSYCSDTAVLCGSTLPHRLRRQCYGPAHPVSH